TRTGPAHPVPCLAGFIERPQARTNQRWASLHHARGSRRKRMGGSGFHFARPDLSVAGGLGRRSFRALEPVEFSFAGEAAGAYVTGVGGGGLADGFAQVRIAAHELRALVEHAQHAVGDEDLAVAVGARAD